MFVCERLEELGRVRRSYETANLIEYPLLVVYLAKTPFPSLDPERGNFEHDVRKYSVVWGDPSQPEQLRHSLT